MNVLAIDGGGIRGIIPALVLAEIESRTGRPIATLFDLVAGTSTGGILACALTAPGVDGTPRHSASACVDIYRREGPAIFRRSLWRRVESLEGLIDEKHEAAGLHAALERYLGGALLSQATTRLLATSYDIERREPYFFKSWRTSEPGRDARLVDVARATSAAPTYFQPELLHPTDGSAPMALVDGGVFANNPAMCAYAETQRLEPGSHTTVLSIGTGQQTQPIHFARAKGWGLIDWVRPIIDVVFDGVTDTVDYQLRQILGDADYTRMQLVLDRASDALDDASAHNIALLEQQAHDLISAEDAALDAVCARLTR